MCQCWGRRYALEVLLYYGTERLLALVQKRQVLEQHQAPLHLLEEGQIPTCRVVSHARRCAVCVYVCMRYERAGHAPLGAKQEVTELSEDRLHVRLRPP